MREKQLERERQMQLQGVQDARRELEKAVEAGATERLQGAGRVLIAVFNDLEAAILAEQEKRGSGMAAKFRGWLREVPADSLAVLAMNEVMRLGVMHESVSLQRLLVHLGRRIHLEALVLQARKVSPVYFQETEKYLESTRTQDVQHWQGVMRTAARKVLGDFEYLLDSEYLHLGKLVLNPIIEMGIIIRIPQPGMHMYSLNPDVLSAMTTVPALAAGRVTLSMLVPPEPWESISEGGYLESPWQPLVKRGRYRREDYRYVAKGLAGSELLRTASAIQEIPLQVRPGTHAIISELWQDGGGALGVPRKEFREAPEYPLEEGWRDTDDTPENRDKHDTWLGLMRQWYTDRKEHFSETLEMAHMVRDVDPPGEARWFPVFFDSRGRQYYRGRLNPQGSDRAKALLQFHEAKPLGKRGLYWLKVALANSFGYDSTRFDDRVAWVDARLDTLVKGSRRPQDCDLFRSNTEAPCMAVSLAQELADALESGDPENFMSRVPVHMDATCSGLQHLSAMLRDKDAAGHVNLYDNGGTEKSDLYAHVASLAMDLARKDLDGDDAEYAEFWVNEGICRDLAKRPVMTYCYGVTFQGVLRYVDEYLSNAGYTRVEGAPDYRTRNYCARLLLRAIEGAVPKAAEFMQWLVQASRSKHGARLQWTNAVGFPVVQYIEDTVLKRVAVRSCGIEKVVMYERTGKPHRLKMANSVVPNFVHSYDAAHWCMVAREATDRGMQVMGVHDSFATHAADVDQLHEIIRDKFVVLYTEHDPVQNFIDENGIEEEPPQTGTLDIELFRDSEFGFC